MLRRFALLTLCLSTLCLSCVASFAATPAVFRGRVIELSSEPSQPGTIYVISRNGALRKVKVEHARVLYSDDIPERFRKAKPHEALIHGTEVRVVAEENGAGQWTARAVEILEVPGAPKPRAVVPPPIAPAPKRPAPTLSRRSS